jgi:hypothetical protein
VNRGFILFGLCLALLANAGRALAHDARPLSILIAERQAHTYRVEVRMPPSLEADNRPEIGWPDECSVSSRGVQEGVEATQQTMLLKCSSGLDGKRIKIEYPLFNPALSTLLRFMPSGDTTRTTVLPPDRLDWTVPSTSSWMTVAHDYFLLGVKHIWEGIDHLLFVAGLLMLAKRPRRIAVAITGFTIAHSITLSLSALGAVRLPVSTHRSRHRAVDSLSRKRSRASQRDESGPTISAFDFIGVWTVARIWLCCSAQRSGAAAKRDRPGSAIFQCWSGGRAVGIYRSVAGSSFYPEKDHTVRHCAAAV